MAGVIAGTVLSLNAIFWIGSHYYFVGKTVTTQFGGTDDVSSVRLAFGVLSLLVAGMAYGAALAPRLIGHGLAFLMGAASFVGGVGALIKGLPPVMGATMLLVGVLVPVLAYRSLVHRSRGAWSFLIALVITFGTVDFFGAPKIRAILGVGLWNAMIIPALQIVCVMALAMVRGEYRDRS
jgi:hypothetical protein